MSQPYPPFAAFDVGQLVAGKYEIRAILGAGGMGVVYEAYHRGLARVVALKTIRADEAGDLLLARFFREARVGSKLRSENLVHVYDIDTAEDGTTYLVMERLHGATLAAHLQTGVLNDCAILSYALGAARGLGEAHALGIVHRDVKPQNIFVDTRGVVKVIDFGLAKAILEASSLTGSGLLGTPLYMAPEQICGREVDARSDVFSLGVVLFRSLCQIHPFQGEGTESYLTSVLTDEPLVLEALRPDLPLEIGRVVMRALERSPADRYENGHAFADALEACRALWPPATDAPFVAHAVPPRAPRAASTKAKPVGASGATARARPRAYGYLGVGLVALVLSGIWFAVKPGSPAPRSGGVVPHASASETVATPSLTVVPRAPSAASSAPLDAPPRASSQPVSRPPRRVEPPPQEKPRWRDMPLDL